MTWHAVIDSHPLYIVVVIHLLLFIRIDKDGSERGTNPQLLSPSTCQTVCLTVYSVSDRIGRCVVFTIVVPISTTNYTSSDRVALKVFYYCWVFKRGYSLFTGRSSRFMVAWMTDWLTELTGLDRARETLRYIRGTVTVSSTRSWMTCHRDHHHHPLTM